MTASDFRAILTGHHAAPRKPATPPSPARPAVPSFSDFKKALRALPREEYIRRMVATACGSLPDRATNAREVEARAGAEWDAAHATAAEG